MSVLDHGTLYKWMQLSKPTF
ncbi:hypothetical protein CNECB9_1010007 [Cupriavidus necator]|uniref:Uncharacterized protein n=1 Tax=Cupriavidus necator TaxID=106590 RepID=A0A1K0I7S1_CUPNE|nr:hypothetical protein CNECB9_1010007 [Cupriavidus necator]